MVMTAFLLPSIKKVSSLPDEMVVTYSDIVQANENDNLSICDVSKIMGHSQISTTLKYSHITKNKIEKVYSIFY